MNGPMKKNASSSLSLPEYAVLKIVSQSKLDSNTGHQSRWGGWTQSVNTFVPECSQADLLSALKRLGKRGILRLKKPDPPPQYQGSAYSGSERDDDAFFFMGPFNAVLTDEGRSYWNSITRES